MDVRKLWQRHRERPFRPYELHLFDGQTFCIVHPRSMLLSQHRLTFAIYRRAVDIELEMPDDFATASPLEVVELKEITSPW